MRTISSRISKLEERFHPRLDERGRTIGEVLRERARRYDAERGFEPEPEPPRHRVLASGDRPRTIAEMLRRWGSGTQASTEMARDRLAGRMQ